ncbi:MAG: hypothetical protein NC082_04825 [Clostridiales bacterium]|nr:hypothetical protein [Clostridiales bacterium]
MQTIFDENGFLNISDIIKDHPSYKAIMEDGIVTDEELKTQAEVTLKALHKLQSICNEEQQTAILDAISEMSVLFAAYHNYELQELRK